MNIDFTDPRWLTVILAFTALVIMLVSLTRICVIPTTKKVPEGVTSLTLRKSWILLALSEIILFQLAFFLTHCNPLAFVLFVLITYTTYLSLSLKFFFKSESITGANSIWFPLKEKNLKWESIVSLSYDKSLFVYELKDMENNKLFLYSEKYGEGIPNFFEHLKRYNPTVELKNITWEKIDKIIENGQNP